MKPVPDPDYEPHQSKKSSKKHGKSPRKTPTKTKPTPPKNYVKGKTKKPHLPLYSTKGKTVKTVGCGPVVYKSIDDFTVPKKDESPFKNDHVRQLIPSSCLKALTEPDDVLAAQGLLSLSQSPAKDKPDVMPKLTQVDSQNFIFFTSQLLCKADQPVSSHGSFNGSSEKNFTISKNDSQFLCPSETERNAAPSVFDVSDFPTCTNWQQSVQLIGGDGCGKAANPVNSSTCSPCSASVESDRLFTETFGELSPKAVSKLSGRPFVHDLTLQPSSGNGPLHAVQTEHNLVKGSTTKPSSQDLLEAASKGSDKTSSERGSESSYNKLSDVSDNLYSQEAKGVASSQNPQNSGSAEADNAALRRAFMPGVDIPGFYMANGKPMSVPKASLGKYFALADQEGLLGHHMLSSSHRSTPGTSSSCRASAGDTSVGSSSSQHLNSQDLTTPKKSCKKPRLVLCFEGDDDLFKRLRTPSKSNQDDEIVSRASHGKESDISIVISSDDEDEIDRSSRKSPLLNLADDSWMKVGEAPTTASSSTGGLPLPSFKSGEMAVSEANLKKDRTMFGAVNEACHLPSSEVVQEEQDFKYPVLAILGNDLAENIAKSDSFESPSENNLKLSDANLKKSRTMFAGANNGCDQETPNGVNGENPKSLMFSVLGNGLAGNNVISGDTSLPLPVTASSDRLLPSFKSAHGENIALSNASLRKAKSMFDSVKDGNDVTPGESSKSHGPLPSFKAAGRSNTVPSKTNLNIARTMSVTFNEGDDQISAGAIIEGKDVLNNERPISSVLSICDNGLAGHNANPEEFTSVPVTISSDCLPSFKSAGGGDIALSNASLRKAKSMFDSVKAGNDVTPGESSKLHGSLPSFKAAGRSDTVPSKTNLNIARTMSDTSNECDDQISAGAIHKDKDGLNNESPVLIICENGLAGNKVNPEEFTSSDFPLLPSFKSARGYDIAVSNGQLEKARSMFDDVIQRCDQILPERQQHDINSSFNNESTPKLSRNELDGNAKQESAVTPSPAVRLNEVNNSSSPVMASRHRPRNPLSNYDDNKGLNEKCDDLPVKKNPVALREFSSLEWEEFPELKLSQAALLEQSACKKENSCPDPTPQATTPLSSRVQLNPANTAIGAKRKSLPALPEIAAKKARPSQAHKSLPPGPDCYPEVDFIATRLDQVTKRRSHQMKIISSKKNQKFTPVPGKLMQKKSTTKQMKLSMYSLDFLFNPRFSEEELVNADTAVNFRFHLSDSTKASNGEWIADSCLLVYDADGTAGVEEITTAFLTSPHVDPSLVPDGWVKNHYRWIVWKLACYERRRFADYFGRCLSPENVLLQLKYRYDREIDRAERSAFKTLLESDAAPIDFICCVASVKQNFLDEGESLLEFELTDGWYSIWAIVDPAMVGLYKKGKVDVGTKLMVHVAEITNLEQGCDPLKVPSNVKIRIPTNSVRRARRFARMGFMKKVDSLLTMIDDILPEGGIVTLENAVVVRKYPVIYMCKDANGKTVYRNERSQAAFQEQAAKKRADFAEKHRERLIEEATAIYMKPTKRPRRYTATEIQNIDDAEELYSVLKSIVEDGDMLSMLSFEQTQMLSRYKHDMASKINSYVQNELQNEIAEWEESNSKITELLKVRLIDSFSEKHVVLTIWRPTDDVSNSISENKAFSFINVVANATRDGVLQLSSTRQTRLRCLPTYDIYKLRPCLKNLERTETPLSAIESPNFSPAFNELDTSGVVVLVRLPEQSNGNTVVYLSDLKDHYLSITFWTSLSVFGCEELITEGSLIVCQNLQWRASSTSLRKKIPSFFASEMTLFSKRRLQLITATLENKDVDELISLAKTHVLQATSHVFPGVGSPAPRVSRTPASTPARLTPGCSTGKTPMSSHATPARQRLNSLNRFGEDAPPLPRMPLVVSKRQVFSNFKSPCAAPKPAVNPENRL